jgi:hypothetical protein
MDWGAVTIGVLTAALCAMWLALLGERARAATYRQGVRSVWH